jgi:hypothetical protein
MLAFAAACAPAPTSNVTVVSFEANDSSCTPNSIETSAGFLVKVTLKNTGTKEVTFTYPDGPYAFSAAPGQTALGNFTAPTSTGRYNFTCGSTQGPMQVKSSGI